MKVKKEKSTTVVPNEKKGAEAVVTKKKFSFKDAFKKIGGGIKKGFGAVASLIKNHKKIAIGTGAVLVVAIVALVLVPTFSLNKAEKTMKNRLNDIGVTFYEDFYFKSAGNGDEGKRKEFLGRFSDIGIKVSLENLLRYYVTTDKYKELDIANADANVTERVEALKKAWFEDKNYNCDVDNTKVIIYPKDPFGEKDYKIELVNVCGFKDEEKTKETTTKKKENNTVTQKATETTTKATTKATKKTTKKK